MRRCTAFCLMLCLGVLPVLPQSADKEDSQEASLKAKADLLGVGADVKIEMRGVYSGRKSLTQRGIIQEVAEDHVTLDINNQIQQFRFSQIETLHLANRHYRASGQVDPVAARRVAGELGKGTTARITLLSKKKVTGTIQSIDREAFLIKDSQGLTHTVPFAEVSEIGPKKMPVGVKTLIAVGSTAAAILILAAIWYQYEKNEQPAPVES